jgi:hypothetical protein
MNSKHLGHMRNAFAVGFASIAVMGFVSNAKAAVLAYEGFDYTAGAGLLNLNGGTGWTSPWNEAQAAIGADAIQAGSLTYTDSQNNVLLTTGGKLLNTGSSGTSSQGGRSIARINSGTTWMSFLAQRVGEVDPDPANGIYPRGANLATFDLTGTSAVTQEKLNIGPKNSNSFWNDPNTSTQVDYIQFRHPSMNNGVLETNLPNRETTRPTPNISTPALGGNFNGNARDSFANALVQNVNLYVIRIDHLGDEMTADDIRVWINPRLDQTPSDSAVSLAYIAADIQAAADFQLVPAGCSPGGEVPCTAYSTGNFGDQAFDRIRLFAGNAGAVPAAEVLYDEIRLGTTFQDVAPIDGPQGLPGDFNNDQKVDAADYTVWRDNLGAATDAPLNGNGDGTVGVGPGDYDLWKSKFGTPGAGSLGGAIPEPSTLLLVGLALVGIPALRRRQG